MNSPRDELKLKSSIEQTVVKTAESILELKPPIFAKWRWKQRRQWNFGDEDVRMSREKLKVLQTFYEPSIVVVYFQSTKVQIKPLEWKKINLANVAEEFSPVTNAQDSPHCMEEKYLMVSLCPQYAYQPPQQLNQKNNQEAPRVDYLPKSQMCKWQDLIARRVFTNYPLVEEVSKVEVIAEMGRRLTPRGRKQAERLGVWCRNQLYPGKAGFTIALNI